MGSSGVIRKSINIAWESCHTIQKEVKSGGIHVAILCRLLTGPELSLETCDCWTVDHFGHIFANARAWPWRSGANRGWSRAARSEHKLASAAMDGDKEVVTPEHTCRAGTPAIRVKTSKVDSGERFNRWNLSHHNRNKRRVGGGCSHWRSIHRPGYRGTLASCFSTCVGRCARWEDLFWVLREWKTSDNGIKMTYHWVSKPAFVDLKLRALYISLTIVKIDKG